MSGLVDKVKEWAGAIGVGAAVLFTIGAPTYSFLKTDAVRTVITDVGVKRYSDHDLYLIYTKDNQVYANHDAWHRLKFNSSNIHASALNLKGKEVEITKYGWRFPLFSWYENVTRITEVQQHKQESQQTQPEEIQPTMEPIQKGVL